MEPEYSEEIVDQELNQIMRELLGTPRKQLIQQGEQWLERARQQREQSTQQWERVMRQIQQIEGRGSASGG